MTQTVSNNPFEALRAPFPRNLVKWRKMRVENGIAVMVPYLDARDIQDRLDEALGPAAWQTEFSAGAVPGSVVCALSITYEGRTIVKQDAAQVDKPGNSFDDREKAIKGAYTEAFKRAAVMWGIGRYLYGNAVELPVDEDNNPIGEPELPVHAVPANEAAAQSERIAKVEASKATVEQKSTQTKPQVAEERDAPAKDEAAAAEEATVSAAVTKAEDKAETNATEAPAAAAAGASDEGFSVESLDESGKKYYNSLLKKVQPDGKAPPAATPKMVINFLETSDKPRKRLPEGAITHLIKYLRELEDAEATA